LRNLKRCRCGSNDITLRSTHFFRLICLSCENKTEPLWSKGPKPGQTYNDYWIGSISTIVEQWNNGETKDWHDEYMYDCDQRKRNMKLKTKLKPMKHYIGLDINMKEIYRDQSAEFFRYAGVSFFNSFLPYGIKKIDSWFCHRIREYGEEDARFDYTKKELEDMILTNPHLHEYIKANLVSNLQNR
jgi:hypothetical protein